MQSCRDSQPELLGLGMGDAENYVGKPGLVHGTRQPAAEMGLMWSRSAGHHLRAWRIIGFNAVIWASPPSRTPFLQVRLLVWMLLGLENTGSRTRGLRENPSSASPGCVTWGSTKLSVHSFLICRIRTITEPTS